MPPIQERTQSVQNGMPTRSMGTILFSLSHSSRYCPLVLAHAYRSSRSSVGMPFVTLCVMDLRHAAYSGEDAERPERHAHAEHGHDGVFRCLIAARRCSCRHLSFLTLQRGNALREALRHGFTPCRLFRRGRRASRTTCPRGAWARYCSPCPIPPATARWCSCRHLSFLTLPRWLTPDALASPGRLTWRGVCRECPRTFGRSPCAGRWAVRPSWASRALSQCGSRRGRS